MRFHAQPTSSTTRTAVSAIVAAGSRLRGANDPDPDDDREEREDEDEVARLGRGRAAEACCEKCGHGHPDHAEDERTRLVPDDDQTDQTEDEDDNENRPASRAEVAGRLPQVGDDRPRAAELPASAPDADVEAVRENEIGDPERRAGESDDDEGDGCLAELIAAREGHEHALGREDEGTVRVCRDAEEEHRPPADP